MRAALAALALGNLALSGCDDLCANTLQQRIAAPDASRDAVVFERDCGATTAPSIQLSIVDPGELPSGGGNALTTELLDDRDSINVSWVAPDHLLVTIPKDAELFEQKAEVAGVRIEYRKGD